MSKDRPGGMDNLSNHQVLPTSPTPKSKTSMSDVARVAGGRVDSGPAKTKVGNR